MRLDAASAVPTDLHLPDGLGPDQAQEVSAVSAMLVGVALDWAREQGIGTPQRMDLHFVDGLPDGNNGRTRFPEPGRAVIEVVLGTRGAVAYAGTLAHELGHAMLGDLAPLAGAEWDSWTSALFAEWSAEQAGFAILAAARFPLTAEFAAAVAQDWIAAAREAHTRASAVIAATLDGDHEPDRLREANRLLAETAVLLAYAGGAAAALGLSLLELIRAQDLPDWVSAAWLTVVEPLAEAMAPLAAGLDPEGLLRARSLLARDCALGSALAAYGGATAERLARGYSAT